MGKKLKGKNCKGLHNCSPFCTVVLIYLLANSKQICHNKYMNSEHGVDEMTKLKTVKTLAVQGIQPNGGGGFKL